MGREKDKVYPSSPRFKGLLNERCRKKQSKKTRNTGHARHDVINVLFSPEKKRERQSQTIIEMIGWERRTDRTTTHYTFILTNTHEWLNGLPSHSLLLSWIQQQDNEKWPYFSRTFQVSLVMGTPFKPLSCFKRFRSSVFSETREPGLKSQEKMWVMFETRTSLENTIQDGNWDSKGLPVFRGSIVLK